MTLKAYFRGRLNRLLLSVLLFIIILISTHVLFEIFHELNFYELNFSDIALLYLKQLGASGPLILNISFIISWVLLQNKTAIAHEQHASLISGWGLTQNLSLAFENLFFISLTNFFILFYFNPLMNTYSLNSDSSEIEWLKRKNINKHLEVPIANNKILLFEGIENGIMAEPVVLEATDTGWTQIKAQSASFLNDGMTLHDGEINRYQKNQETQHIRFEQLAIPLNTKEALKIDWAGLDGLTLSQTEHVRGKAELFWRIFLIIQPWLCLIPFYFQKVMLRQKIAMTHCFLEAGLIFAVSTMIAFNTYKMMLIQPWYQLYFQAFLFLALFLYTVLRGIQRGIYA